MKNLIKYISVLMVVLMLLLCFVGCGEANQQKVEYFKGKVKSEDSCELAQNDNFTLFWDNEKVALLLQSNKTSKIWCTTPYSFYQNDTGEGLASVALNSPINISYIETSTLSVKNIIGTTAVLKNGRISSKKIKNGIRVTYFFDKIEVAVPVDYILTNRGLEARVLVNGIVEGEYPIYKISLHPYMISAPNDDTSYLTVPSGSGGIIYTKNGTIKDYSEDVYGEDPVRVSHADTTLIEDTRLPIFGAANGEDSIMAVIGKGADSAMIETHACDSEIGYSGAYVSFMLRGYDMTTFTDKAGQAKPVKKYSDDRLTAEYLSVGYYPMEDYSPDYIGMANMYRDILKESNELTIAGKDAPTVAIDIMGGAESNKLFLGFPYRSLDVATTINDVKKIVEEINGEINDSLLVKLSGFGESGLDTGAVGGGFKLSGDFGSKKEFKNLKNYCSEKGNILAFDFDLMRYSNSKGGFSTTTNSVKTANLITRKFEYYNVATNIPVTRGPNYYLLSPAYFTEAGKKLINASNKMELGAVSLTTIGSLTYSDYSDRKYYCKGSNVETITNVLNMVSKNKTKIVTADSNIYAALLSDFVTDTPNNSSQYDCIDMDIPLYSMVLKGATTLYTSSINAANDPRLEFLKAIECGLGLNFSICGNVPETLKSSVHSKIAASRYSSVKENMFNYIEESKDYLESVLSENIVSYSKNGQISHTVFSNGIGVYVNFGDTAVGTPFGKLAGRSFVYGKEAE